MHGEYVYNSKITVQFLEEKESSDESQGNGLLDR